MFEKKKKTDEEIKKDAENEREKAGLPKMRQIVIETDGTNIEVKKCEASNLEFQAILSSLMTFLTQKK
jgi:hypothetical protein